MSPDDSRALRVAVAGCGDVALGVHLPLLGRNPRVRLTAVVEPDADRRAAALRLAPGAAALTDAAELDAFPDVDAVVVAVPPALHAEVAASAFRAGRHVYVEKPLATRDVDAAAVLDAWRASGRVGRMGFNYRFNPLVDAARRAIEAGRIGAPLGARSVFAVARRAQPEWKRARGSGGGVLLDLGSHHFDLVEHLLAAPVSHALAFTRSDTGEADTAWVHLRLANGVHAQTFFSLAAVEADRIEVQGSAGEVLVDRYGALAAEVHGPRPGGSARRAAAKLAHPHARARHLVGKLRAPWNEPSFEASLRAFVDAALGGRADGPDLLAGWRALAVVEAAERSTVSGRLEAVAAPPAHGGT